MSLLLLSSSINIQIFASSSQKNYNDLIASLKKIEPIKNDLGLENIEFSQLEVSSEIHTYNYVDNDFVESYIYQPLLIDGTLVALAIKLTDGTTTNYQITTILVKEILSFVSTKTDFSIIYDCNGCYIYDGKTFSSIYSNDSPKNQLSSITYPTIPLSTQNIVLNNLDNAVCLNYPPPSRQSRIIISYSCNVPIILQTPHHNLCWAASIACISNYKYQTALTPEQIGRFVHGDDFDHGLSYNNTLLILNQYGFSYIRGGSIPSGTTLVNNLQNKYPLLAFFDVVNGNKHAVVIYYYDCTANLIGIMDPEFGRVTINYSTTHQSYSYVSPATGSTLIMEDVLCYYWSN